MVKALRGVKSTEYESWYLWGGRWDSGGGEMGWAMGGRVEEGVGVCVCVCVCVCVRVCPFVSARCCRRSSLCSSLVLTHH